MTHRLTKAASLILVVLAVTAGGAAATTQWTSSPMQTPNHLVVLKGAGTTSQPVAESYNLTVNTSSVSVGPGADIVLESAVNASAINHSSLSTSGPASVSQVTSGWTHSATYGVWYQTYNVTSAGANVTFTAKNASLFAPVSSSTNTTLTTAALQSSTRLAAANVTQNAATPNSLGNLTAGDVSYAVVKQLIHPSASYSTPVANATSVSGHNVTVAAGTGALTATVNSTVRQDEANANGTVTVVVNKSLASESAVHWRNLQNLQFDYTASSYNGSQQRAAYHFTVQNASNATSAQLVLNTSSDTPGTTVQNGLQVVDGYTAQVVGQPGSQTPSYTFAFTAGAAAATSGTVGPTASAFQLPVPGFLQGLPGGGQLWMFVLIALSLALTAYVLWEFYALHWDFSRLWKAVGMLGILGVQIGALMHSLMGWLLPAYVVVIAIIAVLLWRVQESLPQNAPHGSEPHSHQVGGRRNN